jgi:hypothetical protein
MASAGDDWRSALDRTLGADGFFFAPLSQCLGLAACAGADEGDVCRVVAALLHDRADPGRQAQYNAAWVRRTLHRFRRKDAATAARLHTARVRLFTGADHADAARACADRGDAGPLNEIGETSA